MSESTKQGSHRSGFGLATGFSRRRFLKASLASAAGAYGLKAGVALAHNHGAGHTEEPVVNAFMLSGYDQPGILAQFERDTGIRVNLRIGGNHEEMFAMMRTAPDTFDVSTVTSAYIQQAAREGLLLALDESRLPLDRYMPPLDRWGLNYLDDTMYGLINRFGYYGLTYNTNHLSAADCESYEILFDPKLRRRVALFDWHLPIMGVIGRYLGYEDPYAVDAEGLERIKEALFRLRPQVGLIGNNAQTIQALASQSYWVTVAGEWVQAGLYDDGLPYAATLPREGGVTWDQSVVVLKNAKHPNNAMKLVEYLAGAHFQSQLAVANVYYSMVPNIDAVESLSADHRRLLNLEDLASFQTQWLPNLAPRRFPDNIEAWKDIWAEFKSL